MESIIKVIDLTKEYRMGEEVVHALAGVSLDIPKGDFISIMGASGSGKSTFMNILGCLDQPTTGSYFFDNTDVTKLSQRELAKIRNKKIGFVFQNFNLLSRTSAIENVELPLIYSNVSAKLRHQKALKALELLGLKGRIHHKTNQLSGGQMQRVAIARALVNEPPIILADEPTGNLDSKTSIEIMEIFLELNNKGITIVLVTHEDDIASYAKRKIVFKDGHIISEVALNH